MYTYAILALAALAQANPVIMARQAVTADVSPTAPAPPGCSASVDFHFGIAVKNVSTSAVAKRQATQVTDGQVQVPTAQPVNQISESVSLPSGNSQSRANSLRSGQVQAATSAVAAPSPTSHMTVAMVSMIRDGQIQADIVNTVVQIKDGQLQAPISTTTAAAVSEMSDGQPIASSAGPAVSQAADGQPIASATKSSPSSTATGSCSGLSIVLANGKLTDQNARTGYIASNFQLQFDKPPQAGAIYTSGFSVCGNGSLAIGGSNVFYQCLSGSFYNLYDRSWAAQCSPVTVETMKQSC